MGWSVTQTGDSWCVVDDDAPNDPLDTSSLPSSSTVDLGDAGCFTGTDAELSACKLALALYEADEMAEPEELEPGGAPAETPPGQEKPAASTNVKTFAAPPPSQDVTPPGGDTTVPVAWEADLPIEGVRTSDGREIAPGGITGTRPLPIPLRIQETEPEMGGHAGAEIVGRVDSFERVGDNGFKATGIFDDSDAGRNAARLVKEQMLWHLSPEIEAFSWEFLEYPCNAGGGGDGMADQAAPPGIPIGELCLLERINEGQIMGLTIVALPAFENAAIRLAEPAPAAAPGYTTGTVEFGAVAFGDLPVWDDRGKAWDASGADGRLRKWASSDGSGDADKMDWAKYQRGFFWVDSSAKDQFGSYKLGFADMDGSTLKAVARGVFAVAGVLQGSRGGTNIPSGDQDTIKSAVSKYYAKMRKQFGDDKIIPPWEASAENVAALSGLHPAREPGDWLWHAEIDPRVFETIASAGVAPDLPPAWWFTQASFRENGPTPYTVTDDGRVYSHIALSEEGAKAIDMPDNCHVGELGRCVPPPDEDYDFRDFLQAETLCEDGTRVPTGPLVADADHAPRGLPLPRLFDHYANTAAGLGDITLGRDRWGVWMAGAARSHLDQSHLRVLRGSRASAHWREVRGLVRLLAVLVVNSNGYPIWAERVDVAASGTYVDIDTTGPGPSKTWDPARGELERRVLSIEKHVRKIARKDALQRIRGSKTGS